MSLPDKQFLNRLSNLAEPSFLCEILNISSDDIIERFSDLIEDNNQELREIFDVDTEEYFVEEFKEEKNVD
jgi:hypothetical protein|tara:strand:+ start:946 stop:1158 length:213 start_codon:yes stop_codon:yes gene_type:complete